VQRQKQRLCLQTAKIFEKDWHDVSPDDIKQYIETLSVQIKSIPSAFVWNTDETRVGCSNKTSPPEVIIAINTKPGSVTIPEVRLTRLAAISAFGDSTPPLFISKPKTLDKRLLAAQKLYAGHADVIRSSPKTVIMALVDYDWLENIVLPHISDQIHLRWPKPSCSR
jgi:hypothetical protein